MTDTTAWSRATTRLLAAGVLAGAAAASMLVLVAGRPGAPPIHPAPPLQSIPSAKPSPTVRCREAGNRVDLRSHQAIWTASGPDGDFSRTDVFEVERAPWLLVASHRESQAGSGEITLYLYGADGPFACTLGSVWGDHERTFLVESPGRFFLRGFTRFTERWSVTAYEPRE